MSQATLVLPWEAEQRLREKAGKRGLTLEAYLQRLAEQDAFEDGKRPTAEPTTPPRTFDEILAPIYPKSPEILDVLSMRLELGRAAPRLLAGVVERG